jgi:hypothetical protein
VDRDGRPVDDAGEPLEAFRPLSRM